MKRSNKIISYNDFSRTADAPCVSAVFVLYFEFKIKYCRLSRKDCEEIFPALFIKPTKAKRKEGVPTILLFPNGSFVIMGAKNIFKVKHAFMFLTYLMK